MTLSDRIRLGDLKRWHVIEASCPRCGHRGAIFPAWLMRWRVAKLGSQSGLRRLPPQAMQEMARLYDIADVARRLKCRGCGNREDNDIELRRLPR